MLSCDSVSSEQSAVRSPTSAALNSLCLCGEHSPSEFTAETQRSTEVHGQTSRLRYPVLLLLTAYGLLLTAGCRRDMQDQPKILTYRESSFYKDGMGSRPLIDGTVPRGYLREDREYYLGKKNVPMAPASATNPYPDDVDTFPFSVTKEALDRGQERYNIYCSVCHGMTGYGDGIIARRGFNRPSPANYHQDRLRQAPVGHLFDVMTNGWGAMPSYASQIPVDDRWKIVAYIRALQLSQMKQGQ